MARTLSNGTGTRVEILAEATAAAPGAREALRGLARRLRGSLRQAGVEAAVSGDWDGEASPHPAGVVVGLRLGPYPGAPEGPAVLHARVPRHPSRVLAERVGAALGAATGAPWPLQAVAGALAVSRMDAGTAPAPAAAVYLGPALPISATLADAVVTSVTRALLAPLGAAATPEADGPPAADDASYPTADGAAADPEEQIPPAAGAEAPQLTEPAQASCVDAPLRDPQGPEGAMSSGSLSGLDAALGGASVEDGAGLGRAPVSGEMDTTVALPAETVEPEVLHREGGSGPVPPEPQCPPEAHDTPIAPTDQTDPGFGASTAADPQQGPGEGSCRQDAESASVAERNLPDLGVPVPASADGDGGPRDDETRPSAPLAAECTSSIPEPDEATPEEPAGDLEPWTAPNRAVVPPTSEDAAPGELDPLVPPSVALAAAATPPSPAPDVTAPEAPGPDSPLPWTVADLAAAPPASAGTAARAPDGTTLSSDPLAADGGSRGLDPDETTPEAPGPNSPPQWTVADLAGASPVSADAASRAPDGTALPSDPLGCEAGSPGAEADGGTTPASATHSPAPGGPDPAAVGTGAGAECTAEAAYDVAQPASGTKRASTRRRSNGTSSGSKRRKSGKPSEGSGAAS